jgi:medium-chain acyl-[acyl-carrier-protein] hydrolase
MNRWVTSVNSTTHAKGQLICLPFAGGGASFYRRWSAIVPDTISMFAMQLPGREERMNEPPFERMQELVQAAIVGLVPTLRPPYSLFGHSLGALICYELIHALRQQGHPMPEHLFVSGAMAPQIARTSKPVHELPDNLLIEEIARYGGFAEEILDHPELMELLLPRLRADFALFETYTFQQHAPLPCPITAFAGQSDEYVKTDSAAAWQSQTAAEFQFQSFPGGHFFLNEFASQMLNRIALTIG